MDAIKEVDIVVDSRESRAGTLERFRRIPGVSAVSQELECADYTVGGNLLGLERKSANDFVASILDGRLFGQIALIKGTFEHAVVLVEGDIRSVRSAIGDNALDGALSYIALLSGVKLIWTVDVDHTVAMIHRMALHVTHGLGYEIPLRVAKPKDLASIHQYLVEGLPGIGPSSAKALLAAFGTPRAIFTATPEQLAKVKGIGPKTIARIQEVL